MNWIKLLEGSAHRLAAAEPGLCLWSLSMWMSRSGSRGAQLPRWLLLAVQEDVLPVTQQENVTFLPRDSGVQAISRGSRLATLLGAVSLPGAAVVQPCTVSANSFVPCRPAHAFHANSPRSPRLRAVVTVMVQSLSSRNARADGYPEALKQTTLIVTVQHEDDACGLRARRGSGPGALTT